MPRPMTVMAPCTVPWMRARTSDKPLTVAIQMPGAELVNVAAEPPAMGTHGSGYHSVPLSVASNSTTPDVPEGAALGDDDGLTDVDGDTDGDTDALGELDGLAEAEGEIDADGLMLVEPDGLALKLARTE